MKTALLFAGQGSQVVGMGKALADSNPEAHDVFTKANEILDYDLASIMWNGPAETLTETRYTQPALFVHEAAILAATEIDREADAVAGHSLGEYTALFAASVISFEDALKLVQLRANLMFEAGIAAPGTMAAVVGLADADVISICNELNHTNGLVIVPANFNSPGQVVVSGSADYLRASLNVFKERGAKIVKELQVSGAFHSPLLASAQEGLAKALRAVHFEDAHKDVYVNVTGAPLRKAEDLRNAVIDQLTSAVQWTTTLQNMHHNGVERFIEIGPGKVLQGLVKRTLENVVIEGVE